MLHPTVGGTAGEERERGKVGEREARAKTAWKAGGPSFPKPASISHNPNGVDGVAQLSGRSLYSHPPQKPVGGPPFHLKAGGQTERSPRYLGAEPCVLFPTLAQIARVGHPRSLYPSSSIPPFAQLAKCGAPHCIYWLPFWAGGPPFWPNSEVYPITETGCPTHCGVGKGWARDGHRRQPIGVLTI